jgi:hypothetical protein
MAATPSGIPDDPGNQKSRPGTETGTPPGTPAGNPSRTLLVPIRHEEDDMQRTTEALDREWRADHEHSAAGAAALARWSEPETTPSPAADAARMIAELDSLATREPSGLSR